MNIFAFICVLCSLCNQPELVNTCDYCRVDWCKSECWLYTFHLENVSDARCCWMVRVVCPVWKVYVHRLHSFFSGVFVFITVFYIRCYKQCENSCRNVHQPICVPKKTSVHVKKQYSIVLLMINKQISFHMHLYEERSETCSIPVESRPACVTKHLEIITVYILVYVSMAQWY